MRIFVTNIVTVPFFTHWTVNMQFNKHAVVLLPGGNPGEFSVHSLPSTEERVSHYFDASP